MRRCLGAAAALAVVASCGGAEEVEPAAASPEPAEEPAEEPAPARERPVSDPVGLWPLEDALERVARLGERGVDVEDGAVRELARATARVGDECAGAFVSGEGLVATSRACVRATLARAGERALAEGWVAAERGDELGGATELAIRVLVGERDVTEEVRAGVNEADGPAARGRAIEDRVRELTSACRSEHIDCEIATERAGARYRELRFLVIPDVRIAYAPPRAEARSGRPGEWPRPAAGAALVRAYVGPDGAPARPGPENEPYRPDAFLAVADGDVAEGDSVAIAGFPRATARHEPLTAFSQELEWAAPRRERLAGALRDAAAEVRAARPEMAAAARRARELGIRARRASGRVRALEAAAEARRRDWRAVRGAAAEDENMARAVAAFEDAHAERWERRVGEASLADLEESAYFRAARAIVRAAKAREAGELERWDAWPLWADVETVRGVGQPAIDRAALVTVVERAARWANINRSWLREAFELATFDRERALDGARALYDRTELGDPLARERLFETATAAELEDAGDAFVELAAELQPRFEAIAARERRERGARARYAEDYHRALEAARGEARPPDASGSLRVSFGRVRGYRPQNARTPAPAVVREEGGAPAAFLASADAAGGMAGAPAVTARGELAGIVLERVREAWASEWVVIPEWSRAICASARGLRARVDEAGATELAGELEAAAGRGLAPGLADPRSMDEIAPREHVSGLEG